ncbi:hypothetical protein MA16_Dca024436 [Dendrobium catenatum]|uniref:Uncharacterized protein n=1 Tax=Dendrobium catenatum TaxID=906689 RepID=A0A2I0W4Z9_9ASPA|nr:hypothetical protein MA16_Dca024436 [Dendrobium catenatum]
MGKVSTLFAPPHRLSCLEKEAEGRGGAGHGVIIVSGHRTCPKTNNKASCPLGAWFSARYSTRFCVCSARPYVSSSPSWRVGFSGSSASPAWMRGSPARIRSSLLGFVLHLLGFTVLLLGFAVLLLGCFRSTFRLHLKVFLIKLWPKLLSDLILSFRLPPVAAGIGLGFYCLPCSNRRIGVAMASTLLALHAVGEEVLRSRTRGGQRGEGRKSEVFDAQGFSSSDENLSSNLVGTPKASSSTSAAHGGLRRVGDSRQWATYLGFVSFAPGSSTATPFEARRLNRRRSKTPSSSCLTFFQVSSIFFFNNFLEVFIYGFFIRSFELSKGEFYKKESILNLN